MRIPRKSTTKCTAAKAIFSWFPYRGWLPGALGAGLVVLSYVSDSASGGLNPFGFLWIAAGWWVRLGAAADNGNNTNHAGMPLESLATRGWYARSRNPMYLGNGIIAWGLMIWSGAVPPVWQLVLLGVLYLWYTQTVGEEEKRLSATFGEAYRDYQRKTPRWVSLKSLSIRRRGTETGDRENGSGRPGGAAANSAWRFQRANLLKTLILVGCVGLAKWF